MSVAAPPRFGFDNSYARELPELAEPWAPTPASAPELMALNEELALEIGLDVGSLRTPAGLAVLAGNAAPDGANPVALAYSGHQFGGFSPRLGDGRALLLGEVIGVDGRRVDVHLKGSGRTPFARGGDGRAVLGPMLREYLFGEAMHGLGIPTTRALAVAATGDDVRREELLPGAVLTRVASSHVRVGTFQYAAAHHGPELVRRLADHSIARHDPEAAGSDQPYLAFLRGVVERQADLVARWMHVGFVHGVMNTDNVTISGETIDYGPCAFMDGYDLATVFSSIDHGGRYAYGNQPQIMQWNLARLAETLLPLIGDDVDAAVGQATDVLHTFPERYLAHWRAGMRRKLGVAGRSDGDAPAIDTLAVDTLADELLELMQVERVDFTSAFRSLSSVLRGDRGPARSLFAERGPFDEWSAHWTALIATQSESIETIAAAMDGVNPLYIARNHNVEHALAAATDGELGPFERLLGVLAEPFTERAGLDEFTTPAPADFGPYQTFCGT